MFEPSVDTFVLTTTKIRGPITVSQYFREALTNEKYGYYTQKEKVFGKDGDFITAPEISQMFGELVGVWVRQTFLDQSSRLSEASRPQSFRVVEMGPGRGTLMADLIRVGRTPCLASH